MIINQAIRQMFGFIYEPGATLGRRIVGGNECAASAKKKRAWPTASTYDRRFIGATAMIVTGLDHYRTTRRLLITTSWYITLFSSVLYERLVISHSSTSHVIALGGGNRVVNGAHRV